MPPNEPSTLRLLVAVNETHLNRFDEVVEQLREAGLHIDQAHPMVGVVTGSCGAEQVAALRTMDGIEVEVERDYQLPPPDAGLQ